MTLSTPSPTLASILAIPTAASYLAMDLGLSTLVSLSETSRAARIALDPRRGDLWAAVLARLYPINAVRLHSVISRHLALPPAPWTHVSMATPFALLQHYNGMYVGIATAAAANASSEKGDDDEVSDALAQLDVSHARAHVPELDAATFEVARDAFAHMAAFERVAASASASPASGDDMHEDEEQDPAAQLVAAVDLGLRALAAYPFHPGVCHLLAYACSVLGMLPVAREVAEYGLALDPEFDDLCELHAKVESALAEARTATASSSQQQHQQHPLLSSLTPPTLRPRIAKLLIKVFAARDLDRDGLWSVHDLRGFIAHLNGTPPPLPFCYQFCDMFGGRAPRGKLPVDGLLDFFAQQSANEPDETIKDLGRLGIHL